VCGGQNGCDININYVHSNLKTKYKELGTDFASINPVKEPISSQHLFALGLHLLSFNLIALHCEKRTLNSSTFNANSFSFPLKKFSF